VQVFAQPDFLLQEEIPQRKKISRNASLTFSPDGKLLAEGSFRPEGEDHPSTSPSGLVSAKLNQMCGCYSSRSHNEIS
jgi:hypothetical protein